MEKEEILKKYRREGVDEGREEANRRGDDAGFYAMCVLALLLMLYQAFTGQVFGDVGRCCLYSAPWAPSPDIERTGTGSSCAWAFSPACCAWAAWDGTSGTRCKNKVPILLCVPAPQGCGNTKGEFELGNIN